MENKWSKVFVGGLSWTTTDDTLEFYFVRFGEIEKCVVMRNILTGKSRGFGFVTFIDQNTAQTVLNYDGHQLDDRKVEIKRCDPAARLKTRLGTNTPRVFIGGLPSDLTEPELRRYFEEFGNVTDAIIVVKDDERKKGFGFISFENMDPVNRLVSLHFVNIKRKRVEVKAAEPCDSDMCLLDPFIKGRISKYVGPEKDLIVFSDDDEDEDSDNESVVTVVRKF